jgi:hypothetical protein
MKKITRKNKVKLSGSWDDIGMEVYWHPKTDYIFYVQPQMTRKNDALEIAGEFGKFNIPLEITIDKKGNANSIKICPFDLAVLKLKLENYGFKNYKIKENTSKIGSACFECNVTIKFNTKDEKAMFQLYFSNFITDEK